MVGPTLIDIRKHVEGLATDDGRFYVHCGRTGDRPVPAAGHRFPDRATARAAARATEQYRSALRRYDPQVPHYDLIVCEVPPRDTAAAPSGQPAGNTPRHHRSNPELTDSAAPERRELVEFCHRVAGAVFETLSESGYDTLENAVMDAYLELAETVGDPDELCLCLLESMASELASRLSSADQVDLLLDAAARLEVPDDDGTPLDATLSALEARGLIDRYTRSPLSVDLDGGAKSVAVSIDGYALAPRDGCLPVLPLTLELFRHQPRRLPKSIEIATASDGWRVTFGLGEATVRDGLVSAPIDGETGL